jgi:hypothetical protein
MIFLMVSLQRSLIAAFDVVSGAATAWTPSAQGNLFASVDALEINGSTLALKAAQWNECVDLPSRRRAANTVRSAVRDRALRTAHPSTRGWMRLPPPNGGGPCREPFDATELVTAASYAASRPLASARRAARKRVCTGACR